MEASTINTVMLIDDDPVSNKISQLFMRKHQWSAQVITFEDGQLALQALQTGSGPQAVPDVILLDVGMPVYDGWDFLEEYEKLPPERTGRSLLYMLSSSINPPDIQKAAHYRTVKAYLTKPLTLQTLEQIQQDYRDTRETS
ncbi:MAG: response regulator [Cytophagales bacterium]|nr:response regulator [Cytophagales bacterium]